MDSNTPAITLEAVSVFYADDSPPALDTLTFTIPEGAFCYVRGGSGAGKSTLLRLIYQDLRPTSGTLKIFGIDAARCPRTELPALRRQIGVIFQDFRLLPHLTVAENVALPFVVRDAEPEQSRRDIYDLLDWVGLKGKENDYPSALSGGEQQRVAIARAIVARPRLLVADEPTGNLDDKHAVRLLYLFEELNKMSTTVLMATHSEQLVQKFPHPEIRLRNGILLSEEALVEAS